MLAAVVGFRVAGRCDRRTPLRWWRSWSRRTSSRPSPSSAARCSLSATSGCRCCSAASSSWCSQCVQWRRCSRGARCLWLGYRSYSLFLIHQPTLWYTSEFLQKFAGVPEGPALFALLSTLGFGAVLGIGSALFVTVERPCITWAKRVPSSRAPALAARQSTASVAIPPASVRRPCPPRRRRPPPTPPMNPRSRGTSARRVPELSLLRRISWSGFILHPCDLWRNTRRATASAESSGALRIAHHVRAKKYPPLPFFAAAASSPRFSSAAWCR